MCQSADGKVHSPSTFYLHNEKDFVPKYTSSSLVQMNATGSLKFECTKLFQFYTASLAVHDLDEFPSNLFAPTFEQH